ncbi:hypothetical protein FRC11_001126, partial [Ceratobasidium sp. 423]
MLIGTSELERFVILTSIYAIRAITPISFLHVLLSAFWSSYRLRTVHIITLYALVESGFYLFVFLPRKAHLQKPAVHPPPPSAQDRHKLFTRCLSHLTSPNSFKRWFLDSSAEIRRENVIEWLKWGFFAGEACADQTSGKHDKELEEYLEALERALGETFAPGYNPELRSIRTTLDEVVCVVDMISAAILHHFGFTHFTAQVPIFPPRPHTLFSSPSPSPLLSYWYKPGSSKPSTPLLFFHGIGIGLLPYIPLIVSYSLTHPTAPIIVPEFMSISTRITRPPLSPHEFQSALGAIFQRHQVTEYNLAAHSYGTGLASALIRPNPTSTLPKPKSTTLLDPIPILLHLPSVARNFLYRQPQRANEHEIYYFACTDMGVAHALARHFFWTECVVWKEDLDAAKRVAVVLSGEDIIVDSPAVWTYLTDKPLPVLECRKSQPFVIPSPHPDSFEPTVCEGGNVEVYYLGGLDHAQMFLTRESWRGL